MTAVLLQERRMQPVGPASAPAMLRERVDRAFRPAAGGNRVGLEIELIPLRADGVTRLPLPLDIASRIFGEDPILAADAAVSFEPGGQLELSIPPQPDVTAAVATAHRLVSHARRVAARAGVQLLLEGTNPYHTVEEIGLQLVKPRYTAMEQHFDGIGPAGRRMMRQTASLQVCLDIGGSQREARERWRVANQVGPALLAAYANSPRIQRVRTGAVSTRSLIWQHVDARRTGFDGSQLDGARAYAAFALAAPVFGLPGVPAHGTISAERAITSADVEHHLSTLFPPVRPRGYLEIRYLDALEGADLAGAVSALWLLVCDAGARAAALQILEPEAGAAAARPAAWAATWWQAATRGVRDSRIRRTAVALLDVAAAAAARSTDVLPPRTERLLRSHRDRAAAGRCPADVVARRART